MYIHNPHLKFLECGRKFSIFLSGWQKIKYFFHLCEEASLWAQAPSPLTVFWVQSLVQGDQRGLNEATMFNGSQALNLFNHRYLWCPTFR